MRSLFTAATGMKAQQVRIDNISNNLANVNTTGFKKGTAEFEDLYYQKVRTGGGETAAGAQRNDTVEIGHGTRTAQVARDFGQGALVESSTATDMAIMGDGFFVVESPEGEELYTRNGNFGVDAEGNLITAGGEKLAGGITIPEGGSFNVAEDGIITSILDGEESQIGQIELARFSNPAGLEGLGAGLYRATDSSGDASRGTPGVEGYGGVRGYALEGSNVDVAEELIAMIMAQRSYELTSKAISTADEMLQMTNQLK
ncbi:MAG: flagellar basal-body rod protein FlgG [Proteobacteria bacterium]|nr:flagellar basal-body rod protein FlgG [Pseudomonadota bacterium]